MSNSNERTSAELFQQFQALQKEVHDLHSEERVSRAMLRYREEVYHMLLGTAELLNLRASQEYEDSLSDEAHYTRKETDRLQSFVKLTEKVLEENGHECFSLTMKNLEEVIKDIYIREKEGDNDLQSDDIAYLKTLLKRKDFTESPEYAKLDLGILYHEICKEKNNKEIVSRLENFAHINNYDLVKWERERANFLWNDICERGKECLDISEKIPTVLTGMSSLLDGSKVNDVESMQAKASGAFNALKFALRALTGSVTKIHLSDETRIYCETLLSLQKTPDELIKNLDRTKLQPENAKTNSLRKNENVEMNNSVNPIKKPKPSRKRRSK